MAKTIRETRIEITRERLTYYRDAEKRILEGRAKAYTIGSRNLTRYDAQLADVRAEIDRLLDELADLEAAGTKARATRAVVIHDW